MNPRALNPRPDAFPAALDALRAIYAAELDRLADVYRARILAGEFSDDGDGNRVPYQDLERALGASHPWLATQSGRLAVEACSPYLARRVEVLTHPRTGAVLLDGIEHEQGDMGAECMTHDLLAVAAKRGWVTPLRYLNAARLYALRVA